MYGRVFLDLTVKCFGASVEIVAILAGLFWPYPFVLLCQHFMALLTHTGRGPGAHPHYGAIYLPLRATARRRVQSLSMGE